MTILNLLPMALRGQLVFLEPFGLEHICDAYVDWLNDPEVTQFLEVRFTSPQTRTSVAEYVKTFIGSTDKYGWAIKSIADDCMIGTATIPRINHIHLTGDVGIMIGDKGQWGTGVAKETLDLLLEFAFETLGLHRVIAGTVAFNHQSSFMLRRAGFVHEGTLRKAYRLTKDSTEFVDGFDFALLADEWRARHDRRPITC